MLTDDEASSGDVVPRPAAVGTLAPDGGRSTTTRARRAARTGPARRGRFTDNAWIWLVSGLLIVPYSAVPILRFNRLDTPSWDNGIFEQAVSGYAHLRAPIVDIKAPGFNVLGDHFSPIVALLAPVYRLFPYAQTLMVAQAVLLALSVAAIGRAASRVLGRASAVCVTAAYGLSFGLQFAVNVDFHEVAFAAPLLAMCGNAYLDKRRWAMVGWALPLFLVKEDLGLTIAALGVVLVLTGARKLGVGLAAVGVAGWALTVYVLIPMVNPQHRYPYWSVAGGSVHSMMDTLGADWSTKGITLAVTLGITGFLALASPFVLVAAPTLLWRFSGDNPAYWGFDWHYALVLMPILFIATLDAIRRAREGRYAWLARYASHVPALTIAVALAVSLQFPFGTLLAPATYRSSDRTAAVDRLMALMPPGSSVQTDRGLITHLTTDYVVYWIDTPDVPAPDYVLIDTVTGGGGDIVTWSDDKYPGYHYKLVFDESGYELAAREP